MACKKYIYAAGDTTWVTTFMEAIERSWKGMLNATLTNYNTTTACSIAAGSVFEVAGSLYIATSDSAIGIAGISTAVQYIQAIGSVGGCVFSYNAVAPTWRDDYQGYYASAASTTRVIGGCYYTRTSYTEKWIYKSSDMYTRARRSGSLRPLKSIAKEIGDWDMDTDGGINIVLSTTLSIVDIDDIIEVEVVIRDDSNAARYPLARSGYWGTAAQYLQLIRIAAGLFDDPYFNATSYNRGWYMVNWEDGR